MPDDRAGFALELHPEGVLVANISCHFVEEVEALPPAQSAEVALADGLEDQESGLSDHHVPLPVVRLVVV